jgi:hypothetical protein
MQWKQNDFKQIELMWRGRRMGRQCVPNFLLREKEQHRMVVKKPGYPRMGT